MGEEWTFFALPWQWEGEGGLDQAQLQARMRELGEWVSWLVARYHLGRHVPPCWPQHPGLVDELKALWYYHREVTNPLVPMVLPDPVGSLQEPDDPQTSARAYQEWHEARWRWTTGPLHDAPGFRECLNKGRHVEDGQVQRDVAQAFAVATTAALEQRFARAGEEAAP